jgi:hypothetical protein
VNLNPAVKTRDEVVNHGWTRIGNEEPIRKFVCGSEEREKKAHEQDEDGKDGTRSF